jgi:transcriptional regulator with PAS, ATPase and Fis domain
MKILISWLAFHEDFRKKEDEDGLEVNPNGPNCAFHSSFFAHDRHILLYSNEVIEARAKRLVSSLRIAYPGRIIDALNMGIVDPINVKEIMSQVMGLLAEYKDDEIEAYISPGTPAMQVAWYLLHLNKAFRLKIFQTREGKFTKNKKPELIRIQLDSSNAPVSGLIYENQLAKSDEGDYKITKIKEQVYRDARLVAQTPHVTVLIIGESGTGKENLAKYIHESSARANQKFLPINCSALNDQLLESRLFGYKKGAFTGADKDQPGLFQEAHKGTIFLDEIGDISPYMQQTLLRVLQERKITPIGGAEQIDVDVRVVAATNKNLVEMCQEGTFRWDLFYRLAVVELEMPPVRHYPKKEVKELLSYFLRKIAKDLRKSEVLRPDKEAMDILINYAYPGNIREMENILSRLYVFKEGEISVRDLPFFMLKESRVQSWKLEEIEKQHLQKALIFFEGNQRQTAFALGITINTLKAKIKKYGL